jgi:hypothetical protein
MIDTVFKYDRKAIDDHPGLKKLRTNVAQNPKVKAYLQKRQATEF